MNKINYFNKPITKTFDKLKLGDIIKVGIDNYTEDFIVVDAKIANGNEIIIKTKDLKHCEQQGMLYRVVEYGGDPYKEMYTVVGEVINSGYITLSTNHLTPETRDIINKIFNGEISMGDAPKWFLDLEVYERRGCFSKNNYGYFMQIIFGLTGEMKKYYPQDLIDCISHAVYYDADVIIFDDEVEPTKALPIYYDKS